MKQLLLVGCVFVCVFFASGCTTIQQNTRDISQIKRQVVNMETYIANQNLLIQKNEFDLETKEEFEDISNYCRGLSFKPLNINRMELSPEYSFHYNIKKWLENPKKDLKYFKEDLIKIKFSFTKDQFKIVEDALNMCGNTSVGKSRIFRWIQPDAIWRVPFELKNTI